jgi:peroxiredoxin
VKRNALVFVALTVAVLAMLASGKYLDRTRKHGPMKLVGEIKGIEAPDFSLFTLDGQKVKLSDYRGKAVLLNFWATWCPPCKVEMPWFVDLQKQYGKDGLVILGVAMDDSEPATIAKFAQELGVNYTVLIGTDKVSDDYGDVQYLPTTFFIGRNGAVVDKLTGLLDRKDIEDDVKKTLSTDSGAPLRPAPVQQNQAQIQQKRVPPDPPDMRVPR